MIANRDMTDNELWQLYRCDRSLKVRNRLAMVYYGYVARVAGAIAEKCPRHVEFNDLVAYGTIGLLKAVEEYDFRPDVKFLGYARPRIHGAIIDGMRTMGSGKRIRVDGQYKYRELPFISAETVIGSNGFTIKDKFEDKQTTSPYLAMERAVFWRKATCGLDMRQRRVIIMYYLEGKKHKEIARELGLPVPVISYTRLTAMKKIRSRFSQESLREYLVTA